MGTMRSRGNEEVSNKFKVGDEVYCTGTGAVSARGVITNIYNKRYALLWHYSCGSTPNPGFGYPEDELDYYSNHPNEVKKRKEMRVKKLEDYSFDLTKKVTPKGIYTDSRDLQNVRELIERGGLEIIGFRIPTVGETYVAAALGSVTETVYENGFCPENPRFIVTRLRKISDTEIINFIERNRMGWGLTNDGYVFSYMGHHREEGKNFREAIIKHIRREERKES